MLHQHPAAWQWTIRTYSRTRCLLRFTASRFLPSPTPVTQSPPPLTELQRERTEEALGFGVAAAAAAISGQPGGRSSHPHQPDLSPPPPQSRSSLPRLLHDPAPPPSAGTTPTGAGPPQPSPATTRTGSGLPQPSPATTRPSAPSTSPPSVSIHCYRASKMQDREPIEVFSKHVADQAQHGHRLNNYLTWMVAFEVHMASKAFRKGPPADVNDLVIMVGETNVDVLSNNVPLFLLCNGVK